MSFKKTSISSITPFFDENYSYNDANSYGNGRQSNNEGRGFSMDFTYDDNGNIKRQFKQLKSKQIGWAARSPKTRRLAKIIAIVTSVALAVIGVTVVISMYYFGQIVQVSNKEFCISNYICKSTQLLTCNNFECACYPGYYFDTSLKICVVNTTPISSTTTPTTTTTATTKSTITTTQTVTTTQVTTTTASTTTTTTITPATTQTTTTASTTLSTVTTTTTTTSVTTTAKKRRNMYDLFMATNRSYTLMKTFAIGFNVLYGISYMTYNGNITYYVVDIGSKHTIFILNASLTQINYKSMINGQQVACDENAKETFVTDPTLDLFKVDTSLAATYNLGGCTNCDFQGLYHDATVNLLYVTDSQNKKIRIYDSKNYTLYSQISTGTCMPYSLTKYNGLFYVVCTDSLLTMYPNGTAIQLYPNLCKNTKPVTCVTIDDDGYLAIPCYDDKAVNLYYLNLTYITKIVTNQPPNCVLYDPFGRLLVTDNDGLKIYTL